MNLRNIVCSFLGLFVYMISLTEAEQLAYIEKHFLNKEVVNNITIDTNDDPFLPSKAPSMRDITYTNANIINAEYKYLDDVILSNNLMLFTRNLNRPYTIHLCLFSVNTDLHVPFLQFMFSRNENRYTFPLMNLDMQKIQDLSQKESNESIHSDDESDDEYSANVSSIDNEFLRQCIELFNQHISMQDVDLHSRYRGFLEDDNDDSHLYVFFDCTGLNIQLHSDKFKHGDFLYAVVEELNVGRINDIEIEPDVLRIFNNNAFTKTLNSLKGEPIMCPIVSYLCKKDEHGKYVNEYYSDADDSDGYNELLLTIPMVHHDRYDNMYMFSKLPLTGEYKHIRRFALFYDNTVNNKVIEAETETPAAEEKEDETKTEEEEAEDDDEDDDEDEDEDDETEEKEAEETEESEAEESEEKEAEESEEKEAEESEEKEAEESEEKEAEESEEKEAEESETEETEESEEKEAEESEAEETEEKEAEESETEETEEKETEESETEESEEKDTKAEETEESETEDEEESETEDEAESEPEDEAESETEDEEESETEDESETEEESEPEDEAESETEAEELLELDENVVFIFKDMDKTYYGTYSTDMFIEI